MNYSIIRDGKKIELTESEMLGAYNAVMDDDDRDYIRGNIRPNNFGLTDEQFDELLDEIVDEYQEELPYHCEYMDAVINAIYTVIENHGLDKEEE